MPVETSRGVPYPRTASWEEEADLWEPIKRRRMPKKDEPHQCAEWLDIDGAIGMEPHGEQCESEWLKCSVCGEKFECK